MNIFFKTILKNILAKQFKQNHFNQTNFLLHFGVLHNALDGNHLILQFGDQPHDGVHRPRHPQRRGYGQADQPARQLPTFQDGEEGGGEDDQRPDHRQPQSQPPVFVRVEVIFIV